MNASVHLYSFGKKRVSRNSLDSFSSPYNKLELGYKINGNVKPETAVLPLLVGNTYNRVVVTHRLEGGDYKDRFQND